MGLNFAQEAREADLRYGLVRVRENAESIAFYGGEAAERRALSQVCVWLCVCVFVCLSVCVWDACVKGYGGMWSGEIAKLPRQRTFPAP